MTAIALLKFAHLLGLVYWLGADLGVWIASFHAADRKLSPETRAVALRIRSALDVGPRVCMTLMLPVGIQLAHQLGLLPVAGWITGLAWFFGFLWLAIVLYLRFGPRDARRDVLSRIDLGVRLALLASLATYAAISLSGPSGARADWVAWKLLVFAGVIGCDVIVRMRLERVGPCFARLAGGTVTEDDDEAIDRSIAAVRPWMLLIWLGLLFNVALGLHLI